MTHSLLHVADQAGYALPELEAGEGELVADDGGKAGERHLQRVMVEEGDAQQRQGEENEVDRYADKIEGLGRWSGRGCESGMARRCQHHHEQEQFQWHRRGERRRCRKCSLHPVFPPKQPVVPAKPDRSF